MLNLALPTFFGGAKDKVAAADVYTQENATPINNVNEAILDARDAMAAKPMRGGKELLKDVKSAISAASALKDLVGKGDPMARLAKVGPALTNAMRNMDPGITRTILGNVAMIGTVSGAAAMRVGNVSQQLKYGTDFSKIMAVGDLINSVSCEKNGFGMYDYGAQCGMYSGAINAAMMCGIPNAYDMAMKCVGDIGIINRVTAQCLPNAVFNGDLANIVSMVQKVKPGTLKMLNPNLIGQFAQRYARPYGMAKNQYPQQYTQMKETFKRIDPDWLVCKRVTNNGPENIYDLTSVQGASSDMYQCIRAGATATATPAPEDQMLMMADKFAPTSVNDEIAKHFPTLAMKPSDFAGASDPRINNNVFGTESIKNITTTVESTTVTAIDGIKSSVSKISSKVTTIIESGTESWKASFSDKGVLNNLDPKIIEAMKPNVRAAEVGLEGFVEKLRAGEASIPTPRGGDNVDQQIMDLRAAQLTNAVKNTAKTFAIENGWR